jgi:prepilin-type N-terminal cleavage/methylation domain-containing protein
MTERKGFTLIELLVVIAIIAILMSILMPALRRVKEQGNMIKCRANLRQWNLIISMYVEENNGRFFSGLGNNSYWWVTQLEDRYQSRIKNKLWFCPSGKKPVRDLQNNLLPTFNIFNAWGIFTRNNHHGDICPDGIAGSYGLNAYVLSTTAPPGYTFESGIQSDNFWRTPQVQGANNIPLMVEALRFDLWPQENEGPAGYEYEAWTGNHMARCCINRHQGFLSASFCDFSARSIGLKELWTLKWHKQFNIANQWTLAGGGNANWPDWIRHFKDY